MVQACLSEMKPPVFEKPLVDLHYFSLDGYKVACYSMAIQTQMVRYCEERFLIMNNSLWTNITLRPNQNTYTIVPRHR